MLQPARKQGVMAMKKPKTPPTQNDLLLKETGNLLTILKHVTTQTVKGEYLHWDKLQFLTPPDGLSHEQWWLGLKLRRSSRDAVPLKGKSGRLFWYTLPEPVPERLHEIDLDAGGTIQMPEQITNPGTKDRY
jgi:hypothetical protein